MENIIKFIKTYKIHILSMLVIIFFFRSCGRGKEVNRLEKKVENNKHLIDSLKTIVNEFPFQLKKEKLSIHMEYDNWISNKDRGPQLMELHFVVKQKIKDLENKKLL